MMNTYLVTVNHGVLAERKRKNLLRRSRNRKRSIYENERKSSELWK